MDVESRVAVVTGAASGIGRGIAGAFARAGAKLVVADINEERIDETVAELTALGTTAIGVRCDVRSDTDVDNLAATTIAQFGGVDILVNNAGTVVMGPPEAIPLDAWRHIIDINLLGVVRGIHAFVPHMIEQGDGYVVNTASLAGLYGWPYVALPYVASKFGVVGLSEGLAVYLRPKGIGVSCLCPGPVASNLAEHRILIEGLGVEALRQPIDYAVMTPEEAGAIVLDGVRAERFLILTHPDAMTLVESRGRDIEAHVDALVLHARSLSG